MIELIKDIQEWHEKTFPEFTAKDQEMKLGEEIGDTVFLIFYSRGKYRVRKKTGYKIRIIRFNLSKPLSFAVQPEDKKEKSIYYWFEDKNPSVNMTPEKACFATLEEAETECAKRNKGEY